MRAKFVFLTAAFVLGWLVSSVQAQQGVKWQQTLQTAKQMAAQSHRLVLIHFWGPSCGACIRMDQEVFSRPDVAAAVDANYVAVKLNAEWFPTTARQYGVTALPTDLVISSQGQLIEKLVGFRPPSDYVAGLHWIASNAKATNSRVYAQIPTPDARGMTGPGDSAANAAQSGPCADRADRLAQAAPSAMARKQDGPAATSGMATAPTWPAYTGAAQPSPANAPAFAGGATSGGGATAQGGPAWRQENEGARPSANDIVRNGAAARPSMQVPAWQVPAGQAPAGSPPAEGPTTKPAAMYPLGLEGFCPVSLREKGGWVPGSRRFGAFHQGRTYLFAGPEEQERFLKNPEPYAPVLSGNDVVALVEQGQAVPGQRRFGAWYDDHVYLFSSEAAYQKFYNDAQRYATAALQPMRAAAPSNNYR